MKKLIAILILCFITGIATVNAAYQRKQKQPNFFIPAKAISNTVDNIPTTEQVILQRNRRLGIIPKKIDKTPALSANTAKSTPARQPLSKIASTPKKTVQQPQNSAVENAEKAPEQKTTAAQTAVSKISNPEPLPLNTDEIKTETPQENAEKDFTPIDYSNIDKAYAQTFAEYQKDLADIKNKTPIENPRLLKIQEDFQNLEHSVKAD